MSKKESTYNVRVTIDLQVSVDDEAFESEYTRCFEMVDAIDDARESIQSAMKYQELVGFSHEFDVVSTKVTGIDVEAGK